MQSKQPVLLDFWASWCGPCRMVAPSIEKIANEQTAVKVGKVNVDEEGDLAMKYGVMSIPTLILFKDGKPADQLVGAHPKADIEQMIAK
jgi:thioredoxin 1